jgi:integrase
MARVLTQLVIERFKPPKSGRVVHWDALVPGFGLRITDKNSRSWVAMYRVKGKPVMQTLGSLTLIPKVDDARQRARAAIIAARSGVNPVEEKRAAEAAVEAEQVTFGAVANRWMREYVERNCSESLTRERRRTLGRDIVPRWGERPAREITKSDVNDLLDLKADRRDRARKGRTDGAGVQSNRTFSLLTTLFNWAVSQDLVDTNPTAGVRRRVKEVPRDRLLDDDELVRFWGACDAMGLPFGSLFQLLLLTAQRRDEVGGMRWSELDLEKRTWTVPARRTKNRKPHTVHLSDLTIEIIERLPQIGDSDLLFTTNETTPVSGFSKAKDRLDTLMGDPPEWILHDLRRTATSGMARLGIAPHVVDKILNHTAGTIRGLAAVYNRYQFEPERKAALEAWGRFVESLVRPAPSNAIGLRLPGIRGGS